MQHKILIVEDDVSFLGLISDFLKESGYDIITATDGAEGIRCFMADRPDLVITDQIMPHLSGIQLLGQIRNVDKKVPVVLMTGYYLSKDELWSLPFTPNEYIKKPFQLSVLLKIVQNLLAKSFRY
jgi:DNA-binding response OmpR family regulator